MTDKNNYIESLRWRLDQLKLEISSNQAEIQTLFREIESKQEQVQSIIQLLASEGIDLNNNELAELVDLPISDLVYDLLNDNDDKIPRHYTEIAKEIMSKGNLIPGKNPSANLLTHISRDNRFVRTAPGTYGLREWGLKAVRPSRSKKSRAKK